MSDVGPGAPPARRRTLLLPMVVGSVLNPINTSVIAVALVPIGVAFGAPATETAWLITALFLATTVGQPLAGRLVDTYGPRRLFLIGAGLTATAGVVGMTAPNIWVLVFARVILGLGTSAAYPASIAVLADESRRTGVPTAASATHCPRCCRADCRGDRADLRRPPRRPWWLAGNSRSERSPRTRVPGSGLGVPSSGHTLF
jgi:hypothetical protein